MSHSRRLRVLTVLLVGVGAIGAGCSEPFAHRNPYDLEAPLELELIALQDTAYVVDEVVTFQLVTQPAHTFSSLAWSSDRPDLLAPLGNGRFRVLARPVTSAFAVVWVTVTVGRRSADASIVIIGQ